MIDSNSQFFAILTAVGEAKQANATALGVPWTFKEMAVGDANGTDPIPNRTQTKLINEWRRAPVNQVRTDPANPNIIITEQVIPADVGGSWIREIGLYDADGDLVAVANCAPSFKPLLAQGTGKTQIIRMNFVVGSTAQIVLKIDPAVVLATREYVDISVAEALAKKDFKHSALVATTANIALSGIQTIDGVLLPADARVLVKDQAQAKDNGLYVVSSKGIWKRAQDADTSPEITPGLFVSVEKGTVNGDSVWQLVTDAPIVLGTTPLAFEMVAGRTGVSAGAYGNVTVDKYGRVIAGTNPTTLAGHGITDAFTKEEVGLLIPGQATEAAAGVAKVASNEKIDGGTDDEAFVTSRKLARALSKVGTGGLAGASSDLRVWANGQGSIVGLSAVAVCVKNAAGQAQVLTAVSLTADLALGGAGGLDTGTSKPNTSYNVFIIWNSASNARALLFSLNATDPVMPDGFDFKAIVSWARTDSNKFPLSFFQRGKAWRYRPIAGANLLAMPLLASGTGGDPSTPGWAVAGVESLVSPYAGQIALVLSITLATSAAMVVAPNPSYGGYNSATNPAPVGLSSSNFLTSPTPAVLVLEDSKVYWACNANSGRIYVSGFEINV
ncbi:phage tail protein [Pseudomonas protegens]|uniref:phage tail protein n=1 Tax=Pseudomonas protegens TaxID=380021 RepID=UPI0039675588